MAFKYRSRRRKSGKSKKSGSAQDGPPVPPPYGEPAHKVLRYDELDSATRARQDAARASAGYDN